MTPSDNQQQPIGNAGHSDDEDSEISPFIPSNLNGISLQKTDGDSKKFTLKTTLCSNRKVYGQKLDEVIKKTPAAKGDVVLTLDASEVSNFYQKRFQATKSTEELKIAAPGIEGQLTAFKAKRRSKSLNDLKDQSQVLNWSVVPLFDATKEVLQVVRATTCHNSLKWMFSANVLDHDPPFEDEKQYVFCNFVHSLKKFHSKSMEVRSEARAIDHFCTRLRNYINDVKETHDVWKVLLIYWTKVFYLIKDRLLKTKTPPEWNMIEKLFHTFEETLTLTMKNMSVVSREIFDEVNKKKKDKDGLEKMFCANVVEGAHTVEDTRDKGREAYYDFVQRLRVMHSDKVVKKFSGRLSEAISDNRDPNLAVKVWINFWAAVDSHIIGKFSPGYTDFRGILADEILIELDKRFAVLEISLALENLLSNLRNTSDQVMTNMFCVEGIQSSSEDDDSGRSTYKIFVRYLKNFDNNEDIDRFCCKLDEVAQAEKNAQVLHSLLVIFWTRVLLLIKHSFFSWKVVMEIHFLSAIMNIFEDTFAPCEISDKVKNILAQIAPLQFSSALRRMFDKENIFDLPASGDNERLAYYEFVKFLTERLSRKDAENFCDRIHRAVSGTEDPMVIRTFLIAFWIKVCCLMEDNFTDKQMKDIRMRFATEATEGDNTSSVEKFLRVQNTKLIPSSHDIGSTDMSTKNKAGALLRLCEVFVDIPESAEFEQSDSGDLSKLLQFLGEIGPDDVMLTELVTFWAKVHWLFELPPEKTNCNKKIFIYCQDSQAYCSLRDKITNALRDAFNGNNCLGKLSISFPNCTCIPCARCFLECYYKKVYRKIWWRRHCATVTKIVDKSCYLLCFLICWVVGIATFVSTLSSIIWKVKNID